MMKVDRHGGIQNPFQIIQKIILYLKIFKFNSIKYLKSFLPPVFPPQPQARFPFPFFFGFFNFVHIAFSSSHRFYIEFDVHFFFITLNLVWFSFSHTRLRSIKFFIWFCISCFYSISLVRSPLLKQFFCRICLVDNQIGDI